MANDHIHATRGKGTVPMGGAINRSLAQTRVVGIINRQDASLHTVSLLHLTFKQQNFFEKVCRDTSCLFIIPTSLVRALFGPAIPTYFFNSILVYVIF